MQKSTLSRRAFNGLLTATGASLLAPRGLRAAEAPAPAPAAPGPILLNSNENPYGPSARGLEAMTRAGASASRYPDADEDSLLEVLARQHLVAPEQVVLGCGSGEILKMADMAFLGPDRTVVCAEPTFEAVLIYGRVTKAQPVKVPLTADHRHDLPAMAKACDARTGLVYVCNPNNPTGTIVTGDELAAFLDRVPRETTVVLDEAYHHFVEDRRYRTGFDFLAAHPNLVVVRTFSKIYGLAGMRLGYAVASKERAEALRAQTIFSNANEAVLLAARAMLQEDDLVPRVRGRLNATRRWLVAEMEKDGRRVIPSEANFVMVEVGKDVGTLIPLFREKGIRIGRRFPTLETWIRISIGTDGEMKAFVDALRVLAPARA